MAELMGAQAQSNDTARREVIQILQQLVRIDTSNPPSNETQAAQYIKSVFEDGIPSEIFESAPGRGNIVARLKGNGSKKPILPDGAPGCGRRRPFEVVPRSLFRQGRKRLSLRSRFS